jgi:hypothetical protein
MQPGIDLPALPPEDERVFIGPLAARLGADGRFAEDVEPPPSGQLTIDMQRSDGRRASLAVAVAAGARAAAGPAPVGGFSRKVRVRGDLVRIMDGLMKRKGKFDAIIVETTGLADPAPVAQTFFVDEDVQKNARLDAVVTVADAKWLSDRLKDAPEAKNQIAFADVIVLNKTDLVTKGELAEVEARIRAINPYAKLHRTERCSVALADVLDPTGAGDSFAGGLMGHLSRHLAAGGEINADALRRGVIYGNVIASFAVEGYGLDRLRGLTDEEIEGRYRAFRALTRFDGA